VGALSFFTILPLAPFSHKLYRGLLGVSLFLLLISTLFNIFAFPFSNEAPLKVYFKQILDLESGNNRITITGSMPFLTDAIIPELPSTMAKEVKCGKVIGKSTRFKELNQCSWDGLRPAVAPGSPQDWLKVKTLLIRPGNGRIEVSGVNTRFCKIYFNTRVTNIGVSGSSGQFLEHYPMPPDGLVELDLWSRTFDREFQVDLGWSGGKHLSGRVGCSWDEKILGRIPALDEVITFLPAWATVSKYSSGLLEVTQNFTI
jgi:hypothetical protein